MTTTSGSVCTLPRTSGRLVRSPPGRFVSEMVDDEDWTALLRDSGGKIGSISATIVALDKTGTAAVPALHEILRDGTRTFEARLLCFCTESVAAPTSSTASVRGCLVQLKLSQRLTWT